MSRLRETGRAKRGEVLRLDKSPLLKVGVVADTHVPDRVNTLHPGLISALREEDVDVIWHAGDMSVARVARALEKVAPVFAVRGNRDLLSLGRLPAARRLEINGVATTLLHGQGAWWDYWVDKWHTLREGYRFERYQKLLARLAPEAQVVVYGHTHRAEIRREGGRLFFNPGAAANPHRGRLGPSFGVLWYHSEGCVEGKIVPLEGFYLKNRRWRRGE